jgi:hypothetical protein
MMVTMVVDGVNHGDYMMALHVLNKGFRQHLSWRQPMGRHNGAGVVWWLNGVAVVGVLLWLWWRLLVWSLSLWLFASYVAVLLFCIFSCSINIGLAVSC